MNEMKINNLLTLKLERGKTEIYISGERFITCKYLATQVVAPANEIKSIDDFIGREVKLDITPETEFWGHCSNLQAWYEHDYDTRLLHSNLSFPLLQKLTEAGDPIAKRVFKEEICYRYRASENVTKYLITEGYLDHLSPDELASLWEERPLLNLYFIKRLMPTRHALIPLLIIHSTYCKALRKSRKLPTVRKLLIDAFRKMIKAKKITLKRIGSSEELMAWEAVHAAAHEAAHAAWEAWEAVWDGAWDAPYAANEAAWEAAKATAWAARDAAKEAADAADAAWDAVWDAAWDSFVSI